jgi:WhiB family redox-sensing transcriptional regulator
MFQSENTWMKDAACRDADITQFGKGTDLFFPPRDKEMYKKISEGARKYCFGDETRPECPVRKECLWFAVELDEQHGIWGGLSHRERNARVRKWSRDYKKEMTLKEYILTLEEGKHASKVTGPEEVSGRKKTSNSPFGRH